METQTLRKNRKSEVKWTLFSKHCIKKRGRLTLSSDIMTEIYRIKPELPKDLKSRNIYMSCLSLAMRRLINSGELKSIKFTGEKSPFYGLPEWFDEHGNIKEEYDVEYFED